MLSGLLAVLMLVSTPLSVLAENSGSFRVVTAAENSEKETENDAGAESSVPEEQEDQLPGEESGEPQENPSGNAEQAPVASPSDAEEPEEPEKSVTTPSDAKRNKGIKTGEDFEINSNGKLTKYNGTDTAVVIPDNVKTIGSDAFSDKKASIVSVKLNAALEKIEYNAFKNCTNLVTVDFSDSELLTFIGSNAFEGCSKLTAAELSSENTKIKDEAFLNCRALATVVLPDGFSFESEYTWDGSQFKGCTALVNLTLGEGIVKIPDSAFEGCTKLASVEIPETVTVIRDNAFKDCSALASLEIPELVTSVGDGAFKNCIHLDNITIDSMTLSVGVSAFEGCSSLTAVSSSSEGSITTDNYAFKSCPKLASVSFAQESISLGYQAFMGCTSLAGFLTTAESGTITLDNAVFSGCTKLSSFTTDLKVTFDTESWYDAPFKGCTSLKTVRLGAGTTAIPEGTFQKCTALTTVTLGQSSSLNVGRNAFEGCTSLKTLSISTGVLTTGWYAFCNCKSLTSVSITADTVTLGYQLFTGCSALTSVSFNSKTVSVGEGAFASDKLLKKVSFNDRLNELTLYEKCFQYCEALSSFTVPGKVSFVKEYDWDGYQFQGCKALKTVSFESGSGVIPEYAFSGCAALTSIKLPSKITKIEERAFYGCAALKAVSIPTTVTSIGEAAFSGCSALTATGIGSGHKKLTTISAEAFYNCKKLAEFTIPSGVTTVGTEAFRGCAALKTLTVYATKMTIARSAFRDCSKLVSVSLPKGVLMDENGYQFSDCTSLKEVTIGTGITQIPKNAFYKCTSLTDVVLPKSVNRIGEYAFYGCKQLINTGLEATTKPVIEEYAYYNCAKIAELTLPKGATFDTNGYGCQFAYCTSLKKVAIGEGMTVIPRDAFFGCSALSEVSLPKSLKTIGNEAFGSCEALVDTGLEDTSVTSIGENAYRYCDSLTDVRFPSTLVSIGYGAFYYGGLRSVTIPASVKTIGNYAFAQYPGKRIIYGYSGSYAQTYAKNNKITFVNIGSCYTVRFNGNGATSGYMGDVTNMPVSKEQALPSNTFKKTGYTFAGWTLSAKGSGKVYADKAKVKGLAKAKKSVTLYAKWKVNTYKVVLNPNGGTGKAKTVSMTYNKAAKLANPSFKKTGYTFVGWNTKANGKGTAYPATVSVKNLTATNGATVKLYAIWVKQSAKLSKVAKAATGSAKLTFSKSGTVTGYEIERSTKKTSGFKQVGTAKSSATSYTDTGLTKGTTYYYRVRTYYTYAGVKFYSAYSSVLSYKAQ